MKALLPSCISISGSVVLYQMELSQIQIAVRKNETNHPSKGGENIKMAMAKFPTSLSYLFLILFGVLFLKFS